jgi:uncharacterized membrane protein
MVRGVSTFALVAVLAYFTLYTGIRGLRYFIHFPAGDRVAWLLPHIGTGFIALLLGPWQFWPGLRKKYPRLHRRMGRAYVVSVGISSLLGLYLALMRTNLLFKTGIASLAVAWMVTGTMAVLTIRKGLVQEHREWMLLNYVLTWSFVTFRVGSNFMKDLGYEPAQTMVLAWLCWVPQLLITSLVMHVNRLKRLSKDSKAADQQANRVSVVLEATALGR